MASVIRFYFFFITVLFAICGTKLDEFGVCSIRTINFDRAIQSEMNYWVNQFWDFNTRSLNSPTYNRVRLSRGVLLKKFGGWNIIVQKPWVPVTLCQTLGLFNSDALSRRYHREHTKFQALVPTSTKLWKENIKKIGPVHPYTVYSRKYRLLLTPPLPSQPSVRKVYLKYLSTSLHQPVFEVSLKDSSQILLLD